jgi:hypothetical protein
MISHHPTIILQTASLPGYYDTSPANAMQWGMKEKKGFMKKSCC